MVQPPSITNDDPLISCAEFEHKKTVISPISSGVINLPLGCFSLINNVFASSTVIFNSFALRSICFCTNGVNTQPGHIEFIVILVVAYSNAVTLVNPKTPCFAATYADLLIDPTNPCTLAILIIRPQLFDSIYGNTNRVVWNTELRFIAIIVFH